jgi:site-specific DNA-adenine methylase
VERARAGGGVRPLFPFYGSKWRDAKRYSEPCAHVIEPFAGSAGYSTYWEPDRVTLIDADPILVGVWEYLIGVTAREVLQLPDVEVGQDVREMGLPQEAAWLIGFWLNRGSAQPKRTRTAYSARTERQQLVWGERARIRIAADVHKVAHWTVALGDYNSVERDPGATYFIDPPYVEKGRYYRVNDVDHAQVGEWVRGLPGHRIVCEQAGADWLPFRPLASIKSSRGRSEEVVWVSDPEPQRALQLELGFM